MPNLHHLRRLWTAQINEALRRPEAALVACRRALTAEPHSLRAATCAGHLRAGLGREAEAIRAFEQPRTLPTPTACSA